MDEEEKAYIDSWAQSLIDMLEKEGLPIGLQVAFIVSSSGVDYISVSHTKNSNAVVLLEDALTILRKPEVETDEPPT